MPSTRFAKSVQVSQLFFCRVRSFLVSPEVVAAFSVSIQYCANFSAPRSSFDFANAGMSGPDEDFLASPPHDTSEKQQTRDTTSRRRRRITYSILTWGGLPVRTRAECDP